MLGLLEILPRVVRQSHINPRDAAVILWKVCGVGSSAGVESDKFLSEIEKGTSSWSEMNGWTRGWEQRQSDGS